MDYRKYHELSAWFTMIAGAFSSFDMQALDTGCKRLRKGDVYVEIGTQNGRSAYCADKFLLRGVNKYAVDINDAAAGPDTMSRKAFFKKYLPDWTFIHKASHLAAEDWKLPIDMIFIDADHSYEGVKLDVDSWSPFLKKNGYIYFHDADATSPGVERLVRELGKSKQYTDLVFYKDTQQNNTSMASIRKK